MTGVVTDGDRTELGTETHFSVDQLLLTRVHIEEARLMQTEIRLLIGADYVIDRGLAHRLVEQSLEVRIVALFLDHADLPLQLHLGTVHEFLLAVLGEAHQFDAVLVFLHEAVVRVQLFHNRLDLATFVVQLCLVVQSLVLDEILDVLLFGLFAELGDHLFDFLLALVLFIEVHLLDDVDRVELFQVPVHVVVRESRLVCLLQFHFRVEFSFQGRTLNDVDLFTNIHSLATILISPCCDI